MKYMPTPAFRQEREKRGWSRNYVAEQVEVDVITVGRWERGERMPHPHHRQKLCALFEMNAQDLGLLSQSPQDGEKVTITLEQPLPELETVSIDEHASQQISTINTQVIEAPSRAFFDRRKLLLAGLGGFALVATVGGGIFFTSRPSRPLVSSIPIPMPMSKRYHHLLDPNADNFVNYIAWSPDNSTIAVATGSNIIPIWNIAKETLILYYPTLNGWVNDIAWSKTNVIAAVTADRHSGSLQLWKYPDRKPIFTLQRPYGLHSVSWSPDNKYLAFSGRFPAVEVWDPFASQVVSRYTYPDLGLMGIRRVKWSASGRFLACATDDGTAHVWEALTGKPIMIYRGHKSRLIDLSWSPDERYIVSCGTDKTCQVWEAVSGRTILTYRGHSEEVEGVAWSPYGNYIASGSNDHTAHVWEALTGKLITKYEGRYSSVEAVRWSVDGTILAIGTAKEGVELWQSPSK
jgi:WD40 repeat protein/transcriptional regulator with XRE-family HTH domain